VVLIKKIFWVIINGIIFWILAIALLFMKIFFKETIEEMEKEKVYE